MFDLLCRCTNYPNEGQIVFHTTIPDINRNETDTEQAGSTLDLPQTTFGPRLPTQWFAATNSLILGWQTRSQKTTLRCARGGGRAGGWGGCFCHHVRPWADTEYLVASSPLYTRLHTENSGYYVLLGTKKLCAVLPTISDSLRQPSLCAVCDNLKPLPIRRQRWVGRSCRSSPGQRSHVIMFSLVVISRRCYDHSHSSSFRLARRWVNHMNMDRVNRRFVDGRQMPCLPKSHRALGVPSMQAPARKTLCSSRNWRISCLDVKFISLDTAEHSRISRGTVALSSWRYICFPLLVEGGPRVEKVTGRWLDKQVAVDKACLLPSNQTLVKRSHSSPASVLPVPARSGMHLMYHEQISCGSKE